jgi:hypothetical protein
VQGPPLPVAVAGALDGQGQLLEVAMGAVQRGGEIVAEQKQESGAPGDPEDRIKCQLAISQVQMLIRQTDCGPAQDGVALQQHVQHEWLIGLGSGHAPRTVRN